MATVVRFCAEQLTWLRQAGYVEEYHLPEPLTGGRGKWRIRLRGGEEMTLSTREVRVLLVGLAVGARGRLPEQGQPVAAGSAVAP